MESPSLSVSIITYNHREFIARAIDSALDQRTDFPVTIHIGDDFSNDGTREILREYQAAHTDRIELNLQEKRPAGIPGRVNNVTNLQSCRGKYVAMLDGDDYWTDPLKLQRQVDFLESSPDHVGAAHGFIRSFGNGVSSREPHYDAHEAQECDLDQPDIFERQHIQTSTFVFRRSAVSFPEWFERIHAADYAIFLMAASHGPVRYDPAVRSVYRQHPSSVMRQRGDNIWARAVVNDSPILFEEFPAIKTRRRRSALLRARRLIAMEEGQYGAGLALAARLLVEDPAALLRWLRDRA